MIAADGHSGNLASAQARAGRLRDKGFSWSQIVDVLALDHQASPLRLFRCASNRSASDVVDECNQLDPASTATLRVQRLYDYEKWPDSGRRPPVRVLMILARIYQTATRRLVTSSTYASYTADDQADIDGADFSHLDPHHPRRLPIPQPDARPSALFVPPTGSADDQGGLLGRENLGHLIDPSHSESIELFRAVTRMEPDIQQRETLFQLALVLGGVSGLPLVHRLGSEERERLAQVTMSPRRVDAQVVAAFENVTKMSRHLYDSRGPEPVLKAVLRFRTVVAEVLGDMPRPQLRERLLCVYGELSQLAGWLLYDLTRYPAAKQCFMEGLAASQEGRDVRMTTFIHCCLSQMASFREQIPTAIDHAFAGRGWACRSGSSRLASYAEQMMAWAFALDNDKIVTSRALNRAMDLVPDQHCADDPDFLSFVDRGFTVGNRACCWLLLDQPRQALRAAEDAFALTAPALVRNRGFRLVDQAKALVLQKEIEEGARVAGQVAEIAAGQGSLRLAQWVGDVRRWMQPWADVPDVRHLDDRLFELGLAPRAS